MLICSFREDAYFVEYKCFTKYDFFVQAPAEIQDKVLFIVNNISLANIEVKSKEFSEILKEQYYPWFAQYMVMKRWVLNI